MINWNDTDAFSAHVESKLAGFNVSLPKDAIELYNATAKGNNWLAYTTMLTDIRTVCPLQELAATASHNFVDNVYSYVVTQRRSTEDAGKVADSTADLAAIFGTYEPKNAEERKFVSAMEQTFYTFVRTGALPIPNRDLRSGMYLISGDHKASVTVKEYPNCDFWKARGLVPQHANLH
jgi:hypothetical protein